MKFFHWYIFLFIYLRGFALLLFLLLLVLFSLNLHLLILQLLITQLWFKLSLILFWIFILCINILQSNGVHFHTFQALPHLYYKFYIEINSLVWLLKFLIHYLQGVIFHRLRYQNSYRIKIQLSFSIALNPSSIYFIDYLLI